MDPEREQARAQLADDAISFLILWATEQEYDPANEELVRTWADSKHLRISPEALDAKLLAAGEGQLVRPPARRPLSASGAPAPRSAFANTDLSFDGGSDLSLDDDFGPGPSGKRGGGHLSEAPSAKKQRMSSVAQTATNLDPIEFPYQAIGDAIGRKVKRYWDKDGAALKRNKGNPWFEAVVTDYDPTKMTHTLTYQLLQSREEYENISLAYCKATDLQLTDEVLDMQVLYLDDSKRRKSDALRKSKWLKAMYGEALRRKSSSLKVARSGSVGLF